MRATKILLSIALSAVISLSSTAPVYADDTDIYLSTSASVTTADILPKILIVFDTSGSMATSDVKGPTVDYDPLVDYQALGGSWDNKMVYWSYKYRPTKTGTTRKFTKNNLVCAKSLAQLNEFGKSFNVVAFGWDATNKIVQSIPDLHNANSAWDDYIDCKADSDAGAADSGEYLAASGTAVKFGTYFHLNAIVTGKNTAFTDIYTNNSKQAIDPTAFGTFGTLKFYDGNWLNWYQLYGSTSGSTKTRLKAAQDAVNEIVSVTNGVEIGLLAYNHNYGSYPDGGRVVMKVDRLTDTHRTSLKSVVNSFVADGSTPLAESLYEAYLYFAGKTPDMGGRSPYDAVSSSWQTPYSDYCAQDASSANCAPYGATGASTVYGYWPAKGTTQPTYVSPLEQQCEKAYVVIVTDGEPTSDQDRDTAIDTLTGGAVYSTTKATGDTTTKIVSKWSGTFDDKMDDLAGWANNNDIYDGIAGDQTMVTFTIGFTADVGTEGETLLKRTAGVGGGEYLVATDTATLSDTLQAVIYSITAATTSFSAPSLSVNAFNKLYNRDEIYFSLFKPALYKRWSGNIKKFTLCTQVQADAKKCDYGEIIDRNQNPAIDITTSRIKDSSVSFWNTITDGGTVTTGGAGLAMYNEGYAARNMKTYLGSYTGLSAASMATPIVVNIDAATPTTFETAMKADPTKLGMVGTATATDVEGMIEWLRGRDTYDEDGDLTTDQRWVFSDPLHSRPLAITFGAKKVSGVYDYDKPIIKLLVAGNDGVIRLIDENTGKEQWSFIPQEVLQDSQILATNGVGKHIYGVDSTPVVYTVDNNQNGIIEPDTAVGHNDKMYAFIGMRRGSKNSANNPPFNNIYAFDITPLAEVTDYADVAGYIDPKLMWVIEGGTGKFTKLGQTWSRPQVGTFTVYDSGTRTGTNPDYATRDITALFFGGGNDTTSEGNVVTPGAANGGNAVFIVDAMTGERLFWASDPAVTDGSGDTPDLPLADMDYPIVSDLTMLDINADGGIDRLYFGDLGGQLWRIDLGTDFDPLDTTPSGRLGTKGKTAGYVFADLNCPRNADTTRNCPATPVSQEWRRMFYRPDMGAVRDSTYVDAASTSGYVDYDLITIGTGDRADPLDRLTSVSNEVPVHNRIYAFRDYNIGFGPPATVPVPIDGTNGTTELYDATTNDIQSAVTTTVDAAKLALTNGKGWFVDLKEATSPAWTSLDLIGSRPWIGEKALARTVILAGVVYATTFTPANADTSTSTCSPNEGLATVYAFNALDAGIVVDMNGDGTSDRSLKIGGGIPSELVTVIREDGTVGLVGASGGGQKINVKNDGNLKRTYWTEE